MPCRIDLATKCIESWYKNELTSFAAMIVMSIIFNTEKPSAEATEWASNVFKKVCNCTKPKEQPCPIHD